MKLKSTVLAAMLAISAASASAVDYIIPVEPADPLAITFGNHTAGMAFNDSFGFKVETPELWTSSNFLYSKLRSTVTQNITGLTYTLFDGITPLTSLNNTVPANPGNNTDFSYTLLVNHLYNVQITGFAAGTSNDNPYTINLVTAAVPEPTTYGMMLAGLGAVGFMARRRKQA